MSVLSPFNSPPATDTQQAVSSKESIFGFFLRKRQEAHKTAAVFGKQQKCFNCFCMGAYVPSLYLGINCTFYKPSKIYTFHFFTSLIPCSKN